MTASSKSPNCIRSLDAMNDNDATAKNDGDTANDSVEAVRNIFADTPVSPNDQTEPLSISKARSSILRLSMLVGNLCSILFRSFPLDGVVTTTASPSLYATPGLQESMAEIVSSLMCTAALLSIDLETAILKKMELNNKKYPVELCKGKAGKYTDYSTKTGITKDEGQSTLQFDTTKSSMLTTTSEPSNTQVDGSFVDALPGLQSAIRVFSTERKWTAFHLPRNLLLALLGELGELAELLQWKPDSEQKLSLQEHDKLGQEIADVSIYLIRLADVCGVSLKDAMDQVVESE